MDNEPVGPVLFRSVGMIPQGPDPGLVLDILNIMECIKKHCVYLNGHF